MPCSAAMWRIASILGDGHRCQTRDPRLELGNALADQARAVSRRIGSGRSGGHGVSLLLTLTASPKLVNVELRGDAMVAARDLP